MGGIFSSSNKYDNLKICEEKLKAEKERNRSSENIYTDTQKEFEKQMYELEQAKSFNAGGKRKSKKRSRRKKQKTKKRSKRNKSKKR